LLLAEGWRRELIREGIEPNPGPIAWGDIEKLVKDRIGGDFNPAVHQQVLDKLKTDVRTYGQIDPVAIINSDHVLKYLKEKEPGHPFSDLIQEIISTLVKSGNLFPYHPFTCSLAFSCSRLRWTTRFFFSPHLSFSAYLALTHLVAQEYSGYQGMVFSSYSA